jgi:mevalonate kinase
MDINLKKTYPSKILLLGEYSVLDGYPALAVPNSHISAWWDYSNESEEYRSKLLEYGKYLFELFIKWPELTFDYEKFKMELKNGLKLQSEIPEGYGAGSSGAFVAAVFDRFVAYGEEITTEQLQKIFSSMESHFHGVSSGLDPLVSYLAKSCLVRHGTSTIVEELCMPSHGRMYLFDSKIKRNTWSLVNLYKVKCRESKEFSEATQSLGKLNEAAIDKLLRDDETFIHAIQEISHIQLDFFGDFIPESIQNKWRQGLISGDFTMKLCGAGGGGYFLVIVRKNFELDQHFKNSDLIELVLNENN